MESEFPNSETALTHILVVADPRLSRAWYLDVLGATLYREYGPSVVLSFAGAWLLLVEGGGPTEDKPQVTLAAPTDRNLRDNLFTIRVSDCQATYELLRARGGTFLAPPVARGAETRCFLTDPDGHLFELSEYRPATVDAQPRSDPGPMGDSASSGSSRGIIGRRAHHGA